MEPFTNTALMPTAYWNGSANVARSATVAGSKTATSAAPPTRSIPRPASRSRCAESALILWMAAPSESALRSRT